MIALEDLTYPQAPSHKKLLVESLHLYLYTNISRVIRQEGRILKHLDGRAEGAAETDGTRRKI